MNGDLVEIEYISINFSNDKYKDKKKYFHVISYLEEIDDLKINDNVIEYKDFNFLISFQSLNNINNDEQGIFSIKLICKKCNEKKEYGEEYEDENEYGKKEIKDERYYIFKIDIFNELKEKLEGVLTALANKEAIKIWDSYNIDITTRYYPLINELENNFRRVLTKIMFAFEGKEWYKYTIPNEVKIRDKKDIESDILYKIDFIQINNFLFKNYAQPNKKKIENDIKKGLKKIEELEPKEILFLIDKNNWEKYVQYFFEIKKDDLEKRWKELYEIRNKIAHNSILENTDIHLLESNYKKISKEIKRALFIVDKDNLYLKFLLEFSDLKHTLKYIGEKKGIRGNRPDIKLEKELGKKIIELSNRNYDLYKKIFKENIEKLPNISNSNIEEVKKCKKSFEDFLQKL